MSHEQIRTLALTGSSGKAAALEAVDFLARAHRAPECEAHIARLLVRAHFVPLKACPCCGNEDLYYGPLSAKSWGVQCDPADDGGGLMMEQEINISMQIDEWFAFRLAAERWNRRPART